MIVIIEHKPLKVKKRKEHENVYHLIFQASVDHLHLLPHLHPVKVTDKRPLKTRKPAKERTQNSDILARSCSWMMLKLPQLDLHNQGTGFGPNGKVENHVSSFLSLK